MPEAAAVSVEPLRDEFADIVLSARFETLISEVGAVIEIIAESDALEKGHVGNSSKNLGDDIVFQSFCTRFAEAFGTWRANFLDRWSNGEMSDISESNIFGGAEILDDVEFPLVVGDERPTIEVSEGSISRVLVDKTKRCEILR